ncbi:hypothetical protein AOR01nite_02150 [Acetobacter orleanensis]|uniref:Uncharacterized protein n=1 Tax=Acetobacter orleanensis TaxID=104099 RepID=A0A4Y3TIZ0_9PROT|nr:hypothetical protein Abol_018_008 [Acetobacter orleanensis JCM 7639]GEB81738.1 hypothetical protein AOR01nite_02150 [Acetobacter orleanensis]
MTPAAVWACSGSIVIKRMGIKGMALTSFVECWSAPVVSAGGPRRVGLCRLRSGGGFLTEH